MISLSTAMDVVVSKKKTKKTRDRRIENKEHQEATFIGRRDELFRKARELSILTGAQMAILIRSPMDKKEIFSFGSPLVEAIIDRFVSEDESGNYSAAALLLEGNTKNEEVKTLEGREWWDKPTESMDLEELKQFVTVTRPQIWLIHFSRVLR